MILNLLFFSSFFPSRPEEVEQLVCGSQTFDLTELKKVTIYDGYKQDDKTILFFWEVCL